MVEASKRRYVASIKDVLYVIDFFRESFLAGLGFSIFSLLSFVDTKEQNNVVVSAVRTAAYTRNRIIAPHVNER